MSKRHTEADWTGEAPTDEISLVERISLLAHALAGTSVTELDLIEGDLHIRLQRAPGKIIKLESRASQIATNELQQAETPAELSVAVMAPLTGVFYDAPSPASPPFVQFGDVVQPGQVVCIIEAMKVFNEIKTEIGGTLVAVPPKSGQLVKKGDPLVRIKPF